MQESNSKQEVQELGPELGLCSSFSHSEVGEILGQSIERVLKGVPNCTMRPTDFSRTLNVSRVMVSRILTAIGKENSDELLTSIPGPETLRSVMRASEIAGVPHEHVRSALDAVDQFDHLIRNQYGTRAALNAALSVEHAHTRDKFEQSSRYQVFKGMSQILGVQSKVWMTCMLMTPSKADKNGIDISTIHGTSGLRRLRPDMPIMLAYGIPPKYRANRQSPEQLGLDLTEFFSHTPAPLTVVEENGQIINTFAPEIEGKDALYDMLASVHIPGGSNRFAAPGRTMRGTSVIPDVPVVTLISDVILHGDIFEGNDPSLFVYKTMGKGGADIEDSARDIDRVETNDEIVELGIGLANLGLADIPRYPEMVNHLCKQNGYDPSEFRTYRLQVQYPVYGFQYVIAFEVPQVEEQSEEQ